MPNKWDKIADEADKLEIPWWLTTLFRLSVTIIFRDAKQFIPQ